MFKNHSISHLLSPAPALFVFPFVTQDLLLHKLGQHFPPNDTQSPSSLHFGEHVVTCEYEGQSGDNAKATATNAKRRIKTFMTDRVES